VAAVLIDSNILLDLMTGDPQWAAWSAAALERAAKALPYQAAFLAGKAFLTYRRRGGTKSSPLPDFFIGAHAAIADYRLLTRDVARYRTYFPGLELIAPG
jgi:predicted nucleic acid-binding protein